MANPSLQIGNSNWAIKESNLLGYSTAGTKFLPQPITMTRASAGTRVNPQGLVETVELLGSEEVTNGDFATDSNWVKGTGWTISGGNATLAAQAGSSALTSTNMSVTVGKIYKVTVNVSATSTGFRLYDSLGVVAYGLFIGENVFYRTATSSSYNIIPLGLAGATGTISNVSVKEYAANNLARVDYDGTASSLLVEPQRTNLVTYSEDFSQWSIDGNQSSPTTISGLNPDGSSQVYQINLNSGGNIYKIINISSSTDYTFSVYIKGSGVGRLILSNAQSVPENYVDFTATSEWQRIELIGSSSNTLVRVAIGSWSNSLASGTIQIFGAQVEQGSYATSYIPTSGSTVTRVADSLSQTFSNGVIGQTEGTMFAEVNISNIVNVSPYIVFRIYDGTTSNQIAFNIYPNGRIQTTVFDGGSLIVNIDNAGYGLTSGIHKFAIAYKENDYIVYIDGVLFGSDTSATVPTINTFDLTYPNAGSINYNQLQLYNTRLTNSELVTLTTI